MTTIPKETQERISNAVKKIESLPLNLTGTKATSYRENDEPWMWVELTALPVQDGGVWWWSWKKLIPDGAGGFEYDPANIYQTNTAFEINNYGAAVGDVVRIWSAGYVRVLNVDIQAWCFQCRNEVKLARFTGSSYPEEGSGNVCSRYPAKLLDYATFTEAQCYESLTAGSEGAEVIVFNLAYTYIPENYVLLIWRVNDRWYTYCDDGSDMILGKAGTSGSYPEADSNCDRFPFYRMDGTSFDNSATCSGSLSEGSPGTEVIAWNLGGDYIPEDTILPLFNINGEYYCYYCSGGDKLKWGVVQGGFSNVSPVAAPENVSVKDCLSDGSSATGDAFDVKLPMNLSEASSLFTGDVVGYVEDVDGDFAIVTGNGYDDVFHTVKQFNGAIGDIGLGWYVCDGSNGTIDLSDKFVVCIDEGVTNTGDTGGFKWHGTTENNHPDHEHHDHPDHDHHVHDTHDDHIHPVHDDHTHALTVCSCVGVAAGEDYTVFILDQTTEEESPDLEHGVEDPDLTHSNEDPTLTHGNEDPSLEHTGPYNSNEDTDNQPQHTVLCFIERID